LVTNSFSEKVINWYELHGRHDLQWRKAITPYRIWISEIMLQQTQVVTVEPYFKRFIKKYPTLKSIKNASEDEILTLWSGLGFYKRARNIFQTKEIIHSEHKGRFPKTFEEIIKLPGIGKSTAGAIMSIAHKIPTPILDGNVKRILKRYFSDDKNIFNEKELWNLSSSVSIATNSNFYTQGIMDIGATLCTPQNPECSRCPLSANCNSAFLKTETIKSKKIIDLKTIKMELSLFEADQEILLRKIEDQEIWRGLWSLPYTNEYSSKIRSYKIEKIKHRLSHRILEININLKKVTKKFIPKNNFQYQWVKVNDVENIALPKPIKKIIKNYGKENPL
jgi:A/G-specific adenine glycosylase